MGTSEERAQRGQSPAGRQRRQGGISSGSGERYQCNIGGGRGTSLSWSPLMKRLSWPTFFPRPASISSGPLTSPLPAPDSHTVQKVTIRVGQQPCQAQQAWMAIPSSTACNMSKKEVSVAWHGCLSMGPCWLLKTVTYLSKCLHACRLSRIDILALGLSC